MNETATQASGHTPEWVHPEQGNGEVFFTNATASEFEQIPFASKRMGDLAYDGVGNRLTRPDWRSVFLATTELGAGSDGLREARRMHRARVTGEA